MKNKSIPRYAAVFVAALLSQQDVLSYEVDTHARMSVEAANQSTRLADGLVSMGLSSLEETLARDGTVKSAIKWIEEGAKSEDDTISEVFARYRNHFYDPISGQGFGGILWRDSGLISGLPAPDWALDKGPADGQLYSFRQAREYLFDGLTKLTKADRESNLALTFRTLGDVVHIVQDMAQPQHTRNDGHGDGSLYEQYTDEMQKRGSLPYSGAAIPSFPKARDFFANSDETGLAQYSNSNFVTAGTNFELKDGQQVAVTMYGLPMPGASTDVPVQNLSPAVSQDILTYCGPSPVCTMTFFSTNDNTSAYNARASTLSIFDQYVRLRPVDYTDPSTSTTYQLDRIFALNRYTFDSTHPLLIPRAVAYSAGLINYFFRGKLEISLPDEGIYSIIDHAVENQKDTSGFRKVKLKLRNVTPGGVDPTTGQPGVEAMATSGKLVAVARFHRNTCYQPDLSGEYGAPGMNWQPNCRSKDEEIVKSDEASVPDGINAEAQPLTFNFQTPIPINASDLYLQVVYRGPLGQENDAVVVATKDIAEPTFIGVYETSEQFLFGIDVLGYRTFKAWYCDNLNPELSYDECKYKYRLSMYMRFAPPTNFDPANPVATFNAVAAVEDLPVSQYGRMAVLNDLGPLSLYWMATFAYRPDPNTGTDTGVATTNQLDQQTSDLNPSLYQQARGVYVTSREYGVLTSGDVPDPPPMNPLTPLPGTVTF